MMIHTAILPRESGSRLAGDAPRRVGRSAAPVLIRVPALKGRPHHSANARPVRRRLRREVRLVGSLVLVAAPIVAFLVAMPGFDPSADRSPRSPELHGTMAAATELEPREASLAIGLSIAPMHASSPAAHFDPERSVVRPAGYVVPDETGEEAAHAGG